MADASGRLFLDVSSLVRWLGQPVGMVRAEHEIARQGLREGAIPCVWDSATAVYRPLHPDWAEALIGYRAATSLVPAPARQGWRRLLPNRLRIVQELEASRLRAPSAWQAALWDAAHAAVLAVRRHEHPRFDEQGRLSLLPPQRVLLPPVLPGPGDAVLSIATDWWHRDPQAILATRRRGGHHLVAFCFDLIPVRHPEWFQPGDAPRFRAHFSAMLAGADAIICNADRTRADLQALAHEEGLTPPQIHVLPLGQDGPRAVSDVALPPPLRPRGYALFVSTIEPRKNHALLMDAWQALLAEGIPQRHDVRLVFVGRPGWMTEAVQHRIRTGPWHGTLHHLPRADDGLLQALMRDATSGLYPSLYEGFGLPVVEMMALGRPMIVAAGGALEEAAQGLTPALPPDDPAAWARLMRRWIERPDEAEAVAAAISARFRLLSWEKAAGAILAAARGSSAPA